MNDNLFYMSWAITLFLLILLSLLVVVIVAVVEVVVVLLLLLLLLLFTHRFTLLSITLKIVLKSAFSSVIFFRFEYRFG